MVWVVSEFTVIPVEILSYVVCFQPITLCVLCHETFLLFLLCLSMMCCRNSSLKILPSNTENLPHLWIIIVFTVDKHQLHPELSHKYLYPHQFTYSCPPLSYNEHFLDKHQCWFPLGVQSLSGKTCDILLGSNLGKGLKDLKYFDKFFKSFPGSILHHKSDL